VLSRISIPFRFTVRWQNNVVHAISLWGVRSDSCPYSDKSGRCDGAMMADKIVKILAAVTTDTPPRDGVDHGFLPSDCKAEHDVHSQLFSRSPCAAPQERVAWPSRSAVTSSFERQYRETVRVFEVAYSASFVETVYQTVTMSNKVMRGAFHNFPSSQATCAAQQAPLCAPFSVPPLSLLRPNIGKS